MHFLNFPLTIFLHNYYAISAFYIVEADEYFVYIELYMWESHKILPYRQSAFGRRQGCGGPADPGKSFMDQAPLVHGILW